MTRHFGTVSPADAKAIVRATKIEYQPINPVATFEDEYGDTQIIHRPKGRGVRQFRALNTPTLRLNRAVAMLLAQRIRARRLELKLTHAQVAIRAGMHTVSPKQYIAQIERAGKPGYRSEGIRLGTLYAIAHALETTPAELMPSPVEVMELAGVAPEEFRALAA